MHYKIKSLNSKICHFPLNYILQIVYNKCIKENLGGRRSPHEEIGNYSGAVLALAFLGTGTAHALVPGVDIMDTEVGYGYNATKDGIHSAHIEIKPIPKVVVGAGYRHWNHAGNETDVYAKYKIGHLYIGAGNRNYYDRDAKLFGLIEGRANVLGPVDAYAGLKVSSEEREYKAGLQLDLVPTSFDVDVNYTYYDRDDVKNEGGLGVGLNYHF